MGSSLATCALTNLPIRDGDAVVAYVLHVRRGKGGTGSLTATEMANPFGLPVTGHYVEGGGIRRVAKDSASAWWVPYLLDAAPELQNTFREAVSKRVLASVESLINKGIHEEEVYVGRPRKKDEQFSLPTSPLGLMYMHKDAYNRFMAVGCASSDWMVPNGDPVTHFKKTFSKHVKRVIRLSEAKRIAAEKLGQAPEGADRSKLQKAYMGRSTTLRNAIEGYRCFGWDSPEVLLSIFKQAEADPEVLTELAKHVVFDTLMEISRKHWAVQCGGGADNDGISLQVEMAKYVLEVAKTA